VLCAGRSGLHKTNWPNHNSERMMLFTKEGRGKNLRAFLTPVAEDDEQGE